MTEPTPGPWAICTDPPNPSWYAGTTIYSKSQGTRVCDLCVISPQKEADGHLIAAAPETAAERDRLREINADLLEALTALADDAMHHCDGDDRSITLDVTIGRALDLIAKATPNTATGDDQ